MTITHTFKTLKPSVSRDETKSYDKKCKSEATNKMLNLDLQVELEPHVILIPEQGPAVEDDMTTTWASSHEDASALDDFDLIDSAVIELLENDPSADIASIRAQLGLPEVSLRGRHKTALDLEDFQSDEDFLAANGMHIVTLR